MVLDIIFIVCICICAFIIWNLLRKIERIQEAYEESEITNATLYESITTCYKDMLDIDDKGVFQSDDETGAVFKQLKETVEKSASVVGGDLDG